MSGETATVQNTIKNAKAESRLIIGAKSVKRNIKNGSIEAVICSSTCPQAVKNEMQSDSKTFNFKIIEFGSDSSILGELCGKPFGISTVGIKTKFKPKTATIK